MTTRKTEGYRHMTPAERDECITLYLAGATLDSLSALYQRERTTIVRLVKRRGANRGKPQKVLTNRFKAVSSQLCRK